MYRACVMRAGMIHGLGLFLLVLKRFTRRRERKEKKQMIKAEKAFRGFDSSRDIADVDLDILCPEIIEWVRVDKTFEGRTVIMLTPRYDSGKGMFQFTDFTCEVIPITEG